eukprot:TRINITY_DN4505_c2_g5_i3.p1 TRINITY_DN4505_c2_g5~~TRINITY_DN4505_c2_g5_i3.p1  ORF type:complete len:124 (-),score=4.52 TRINITY_DN4505_c2_g5_i3:154-525(-)
MIVVVLNVSKTIRPSIHPSFPTLLNILLITYFYILSDLQNNNAPSTKKKYTGKSQFHKYPNNNQNEKNKNQIITHPIFSRTKTGDQFIHELCNEFMNNSEQSIFPQNLQTKQYTFIYKKKTHT